MERGAYCAFLNAKIKISQDFGNRQSALWKKSFTYLVPYAGEHAVERTLSALKPLALKQYVTETTMSYRPEHWENMRQQLKQLGVTRQYVVIQPTARQLFKCWDNDKFSQVIDAVQRRGYQVVLTSGPAADEMACVDAIARGCETKPVTGLAGKTRFPELGALIGHADLFIGVDSALVILPQQSKRRSFAFSARRIMCSGVPDRRHHSVLGRQLSADA